MEKLDAIDEAPLPANSPNGVAFTCPAETSSSIARIENEWHDEIPDQPQPAMLRLYDENSGERKLIGTTSFFRNRTLLRTLLEQLDPNAQELNVLVHAASIGCDVYSFAIAWELFFEGRRCPRLKCFATDLSPVFLQQAKNAVYPAAV